MAAPPLAGEASPFEDVVADVLRGAAGGAFASYNEFCSPWGFAFPAGGNASFHVVFEGQCWLRLPGLPPTRLATGDVMLLPHGDGHTIVDRPDRPPVAFDPQRHANARQRGRDQVSLLCGVYRLGQSRPNPVRPLLPPFVHLQADEVRADAAFAAVLGALRDEAIRRPAGHAVVERLVETLFVYIVRAFREAHAPPDSEAGAGLLDPQLSRSLAQIHADPARRWTVASLADAAGLSRAAFARRFADAVGQPPLAYVTSRRMDVAAQLLRDRRRSLAEVAATVGYDSEFAFSRAFKRERGVSPGRFRASPGLAERALARGALALVSADGGEAARRGA
ncbi:MAG TPA: AraC family transcriptional regulator [Polyangiaceae bacterium]|nr:AraC family transcriptional regulator [Polyangiaceae bacterium]